MRLLRKLLSITVLLIMGLFVLNNSLFIHIHILDGGSQIVHAHPFKKAQEGKSVPHKHTKQELIYLDNLAIEYILLLLSFVLILVNINMRKSISISTFYFSYLSLLPTGRAPPHALASL